MASGPDVLKALTGNGKDIGSALAGQTEGAEHKLAGGKNKG